jgi:hypothetical protein
MDNHQSTKPGAAPRSPQQQRDVEDRKRIEVPPEPSMPDEVGEETPRLDRMSAVHERPQKSDDASGIAADDEHRGEQRKQRHAEGATEVSETD